MRSPIRCATVYLPLSDCLAISTRRGSLLLLNAFLVREYSGVSNACVSSKGVLGALCAGLLLMGGIAEAIAQRARFVAPPRTIADITAILDQEKPDPAKRAKMEADAAAEPLAHADAGKLKDFYFRRAQARASVGRLHDAIADCEKAVAKASDYGGEGSRIELFNIPNATERKIQGSHRIARKNGAKIERHPAAQ